MPRHPYYLVPLPTKVVEKPDPDNPGMTIEEIVSVLDITEQHLSWEYPGQITLRSIYTGDETVISRGVGRLAGQITIGEISNELDASIMESWISALLGPYTVCDLPLHRPTVESDFIRTVGSTSVINGAIQTELVNPHNDDLRVGHFVKSDFRVLMVSEIKGPTSIVLMPQIALDNNVTIGSAASIRIKVDTERGGDLSMRRTPHWYGPWSFNWIEIPVNTEEETD